MNLVQSLRYSLTKKKDYSSSIDDLNAYSPKIYGIHSNDVNSLDSGFIPYANHLLLFISHWVSINVDYDYEVVITRRSWYSQKKVTTIYEDYKNGLSWYIYGNAISINVFKKKYNELFTTNSQEDVVRETINFKDGSARKFILDANEWFINNKLTINSEERTVKIFGIFPSLKQCLTEPISNLFKTHRDDVDTIYWGGLFSNHSNFSHWEWHPGLLPNEIWKKRETFLNSSYADYDFNQLLSSESQGSVYSKKFLPNHYALAEEDYLSLIKLKIKVNLSREYSIIELFDWANTNQYSLKQMIDYYNLQGDYVNTSLFNYLKLLSGGISMAYDDDNRIYLRNTNGLLTIEYDENENYYLMFYDEFGDKISLDSNITFTLPVDARLSSDEFDIIELDIDDEINELYSSTTTDVTVDQINDEIAGLITSRPDARFDVNEHGLIGEISILPDKVLSIDELISNSKNELVFEEMITPPNQVTTSKTKSSKIVDISNIRSTKDIRNESKIDQMVNPEDLF